MRPQFSVNPVVRVQLDHDEDFGRGLIIGFMRWCEANDIIGYGGTSTGPTGLVQYFDDEHADAISEWFRQQGVRQVGTT